MIPRRDFKRFLESRVLEVTQDRIKELNKGNSLLRYIDTGKAPDKAIKKARKKPADWLINEKQRRGVYGDE